MSYVDVLLSLGAAALIFGFIKLYTHRRKFKDLVSTRVVVLPGKRPSPLHSTLKLRENNSPNRQDTASCGATSRSLARRWPFSRPGATHSWSSRT